MVVGSGIYLIDEMIKIPGASAGTRIGWRAGK